MDWGLKNRIGKIISPRDNRALMLAVDHGYFLGPTEKLEDLKSSDLSKKSHKKDFYIKLSFIIREYIEKSFFMRINYSKKIYRI